MRLIKKVWLLRLQSGRLVKAILRGAVRVLCSNQSVHLGVLVVCDQDINLKDVVSFACGESANQLLKAIASLVDIVKFGKLQNDFFFCASVTPLLKGKGDVRPVRPIAVGIVWRRLTGQDYLLCC